MSQEPNFLNRSSEGAGLGRVGAFEVQPLPWGWVRVALLDVHICVTLSQKKSHWLPHGACWGGSQGHGGMKIQIRACPVGCDPVWLPVLTHLSFASAETPFLSFFPPETIWCSPGHLGSFSIRAEICLWSLPGCHSGSFALWCSLSSDECLLRNTFMGRV